MGAMITWFHIQIFLSELYKSAKSHDVVNTASPS
jgi:hypothetical protein